MVMKSAVYHLNVVIISFLYWESVMRKVALVVDLDEGIANRLVSFKSVVLKCCYAFEDLSSYNECASLRFKQEVKYSYKVAFRCNQASFFH